MNRPNIHDTDELAILATRAGSHFFDADAKRFFGSRIHAAVYGNRYFVTSEQYRPLYGPDEARRYTVREFKFSTRTRADGRIVDTVEINTVGEFQGYDTRDQAHRVAAELGAVNALALSGIPFPTTNAVILANTTAGRIDPDTRA